MPDGHEELTAARTRLTVLPLESIRQKLFACQQSFSRMMQPAMLDVPLIIRYAEDTPENATDLIEYATH